MSLIKPPVTPIAQKKESNKSFHGENWIDPYAWLKAENWQDALDDSSCLPEPIAEYLRAENDYCDQAMKGLSPLQSSLIAEMRGRMAGNDDSVPQRNDHYKYFEKYIENAEHEFYMRTDLEGGNEELLFDVNLEAIKHDYFELGQLEHSFDHSKVFWTSDVTGAEQYDLFVRDLSTGYDSECLIQNIEMATWADNNTLFYTRLDDSHRALTVFKHILGSNTKDDVLIYKENDDRFSCGVYVSLSGDYLFITTSMNDQDEVWFIPTNDLTAKPKLVQARSEGLEYGVDHQDERFIICTNSDGAEDFKVVECPIASTSIENWKDIIPSQPGRMIDDIVVYKDWIVWLENFDALPSIKFMDNKADTHTIEFSEEAFSVDLITGLEYDASKIQFEYSSLTTPSQTFELDLETGDRVLLKSEHIPSGHDPKDYVTRRFSVASQDGASVPVTILYHKDTALDGTAAAVLYGYGAYGASCYAEFGHERLSLVDRGFIYAIAHVRGGQEKGRAWYNEAKFESKPNSFLDFTAAGEALIDLGYCHPKKLVSIGGSAGGLLVAASLNLKPELFAACVAHVPFVDVLNTMLDDSLPLTPSEWTQWGNPIESRTAFKSIQSYCPYENVKAVAYPPIYVTAGVSDPRVTYWEPAKWVAKLRDTKLDNNLILFKTNMQSGHFGKTGRYAELEDSAKSFAFAIAVTSLT